MYGVSILLFCDPWAHFWRETLLVREVFATLSSLCLRKNRCVAFSVRYHEHNCFGRTSVSTSTCKGSSCIQKTPGDLFLLYSCLQIQNITCTVHYASPVLREQKEPTRLNNASQQKVERQILQEVEKTGWKKTHDGFKNIQGNTMYTRERQVLRAICEGKDPTSLNLASPDKIETLVLGEVEKTGWKKT